MSVVTAVSSYVPRNMVRRPGWSAIAALLVLTARPALAQSEESIFDTTVVQDINLLMNARDLRDLRDHYEENTYYPADFVWRDVKVRNVGIRSRGWGSRNPVKPGLRIDFNRYVTGQTFAETAAIVLDNLWQDPSMIREAVAMSFIDRMGEVASRESFARVFINGDFQGVYAVVEEPNTGYLKRRFGADTGVLFEYHWLRPYDFDALGDLDEYERMFERRTHEKDPAALVYEPLRAMLEANAYPAGEVWRERIDSYLDVPQMIRYAAIESFLADIDGFTGQSGVTNFYIYRPADSNRHLFLPWDRDHAMWQRDLPIFERVDSNHLLSRALADPALRALYLQTMERCAASALEDNWLEGQVSRLAALVASAAPFDTRLPYTADDHDIDLSHVLDFARLRSGFVRDQIELATRQGARRR